MQLDVVDQTGAEWAAVEPALPGWRRLLARRHGGVLLLCGLMLTLAMATRIVLVLASAGGVSWSWPLLAAFGWGVVFDAAAALLVLSPLVVLLAALPRRCFARRLVRGAAYAGVFFATAGLLFVALAEAVFWNEFGARLNFIAVDYLVYTTEVVANIWESYPLPLLLGGIAALAAGVTWLLARTGCLRTWLAASDEPAVFRWSWAVAWLFGALIAGAGLAEDQLPAFANNFDREIAKNGIWSFFAAFRANQLDYEQFYPTMPVDATFARVRQLLAADGNPPLRAEAHDLLRQVTHAGPEQRLNVIQITVESLSASFLGYFGNTEGITPNLDALIPQALVFDRFYATGTRTDRGMEALTLSVPPTPGRSLVKRARNEHLFTLGSVFRSRGYDTAFLYGGYGYFDNMNYFFGENGYRVVDRAAVAADDVTFANAWGACDGDLYRWTLREADAAYAAGKPFFHFVMTTSNHRPYTFPDDTIYLRSRDAGRPGAVKYTDHAIGEFLAQAATRPWYRDTVFVIVADHCASSAGRAQLPVENYHIPLILYAPGGQLPLGRVRTLTSQIDYAPTLLGLLGWSYPSRFFGRDVLAPAVAGQPGRALIGNYQRLGLYVDAKAVANVAVLAPVRAADTFHFDERSRATTEAPRDAALLADAIAYYEAASLVFEHGRQHEYSAAAP